MAKSVGGHSARAKLEAEGMAAVSRLVRLNPPGRISLAGAYALGYGALGMAQQEDDGEEWFDELDALDTLFLGTVFPQRFRDCYEFSNARDAWLSLLRPTVHWKGIEQFVRLTLDISNELNLPVDDGKLLLIIAGKVEAAKLDQRKIPKTLLPEVALSSSRAAVGPPTNFTLPQPVDNGVEVITRFWASTQVALEHDGSAADALREGCHLLDKAGLAPRENNVALLPALYAALVAKENEPLQDLQERAVAWAYGLADKSPLTAVVDTILVGAENDLNSDDILARLHSLKDFTLLVASHDRRWHSCPGEALRSLAFELGYPQVIRRDHKTLRLDSGGVAMLRTQLERFEEKFGRPPGPGDPIFFDPDEDEPTPMSLLDMESTNVEMLTRLGVTPAWIYASQHTGGLLPRLHGGFNSDTDRSEWEDAVARYLRTHPDATFDHDEEVSKLRSGVAISSIGMAISDPGYGRSLVQRWRSGNFEQYSDADLVHAQLQAMADELIHALSHDPMTLASAKEHARAWGGTELAQQVDAAMGSNPAHAQPGVLLAVFAANPTLGPDEDGEIDLADDADDVCEDIVERMLDTGDLDLPRRVLEAAFDRDHDEVEETGPAVAMLVAHAMGYLVAIRDAGITPDDLDIAVQWVGADHGVEYAGPAGIVAALAGHPTSEQFLRQKLKVRDVTVTHLMETLGMDFFPAMMWLCAGLTATQADGDIEWLQQYRTGS